MDKNETIALELTKLVHDVNGRGQTANKTDENKVVKSYLKILDKLNKETSKNS